MGNNCAKGRRDRRRRKRVATSRFVCACMCVQMSPAVWQGVSTDELWITSETPKHVYTFSHKYSRIVFFTLSVKLLDLHQTLSVTTLRLFAMLFYVFMMEKFGDVKVCTHYRYVFFMNVYTWGCFNKYFMYWHYFMPFKSRFQCQSQWELTPSLPVKHLTFFGSLFYFYGTDSLKRTLHSQRLCITV